MLEQPSLSKCPSCPMVPHLPTLLPPTAPSRVWLRAEDAQGLPWDSSPPASAQQDGGTALPTLMPGLISHHRCPGSIRALGRSNGHHNPTTTRSGITAHAPGSAFDCNTAVTDFPLLLAWVFLLRLSLTFQSHHLTSPHPCAPARDCEGAWEHEDPCLPRRWDTGAGLYNPDTKVSHPGVALGLQRAACLLQASSTHSPRSSTTLSGAPAKPRTQEQGDPALTPPCSTLLQNFCAFFLREKLMLISLFFSFPQRHPSPQQGSGRGAGKWSILSYRSARSTHFQTREEAVTKEPSPLRAGGPGLCRHCSGCT